MHQAARKLWGTVGFICLMVVYPLAVVAVSGNWLAGLPWWAAIAAVIVAALVWLGPAMLLVRWMARPD